MRPAVRVEPQLPSIVVKRCGEVAVARGADPPLVVVLRILADACEVLAANGFGLHPPIVRRLPEGIAGSLLATHPRIRDAVCAENVYAELCRAAQRACVSRTLAHPTGVTIYRVEMEP